MALFVYNSGYGYDALEYLIIGRSLAEGQPFYAIVPSKSWAIYYLVAAFFRLPYSQTHAAIAALIVAILLLVVVVTYRVVAARFGTRAAAGASAVVLVAGVFAELNYLEPTGFVYVCGLLAFAAATADDASRSRRAWLITGAWIGAGMAFKSVAGFYLIGVLVWLVLWERTDRSAGDRPWLEKAGLVIVGFAAVAGVQAAYFWATGRLQPYIEWTYLFPLFYYPAHPQWVSKLYTKLLWVWLAVGAAGAISLAPSIRRAIYDDRRTLLMIAFGGCGLIPLLKSQSSHYAFPGAAFLLLYAVVVYDAWLVSHPTLHVRRVAAIGVALLAAFIGSGILYRPSAARRLTTLRSFAADEQRLRAAVQPLVPPGSSAIFLGHSTLLYWIAERYPAWKVPNTDVQTTYYVQRHGEELLRAFDDPKLSLVEFDPAATEYDDPMFLDSAASRSFLDAVACRLNADFIRHDDPSVALVLWTRKPASQHDDALRGNCLRSS